MVELIIYFEKLFDRIGADILFYNSNENQHGLAHDPFKAIVAPRPIGWIGSKGADGSLNLAPYSFFNAIADDPKLIMFASGGKKDSVRNCEETGVFSVNMVGFSQVDAMNQSSAPYDHGVDEFEKSGLTSRQCELIDAPLVVGAFAVLECKVTEIIRPKTVDGEHPGAYLVTGQVMGIHIRDDVIVDGRISADKTQTVSRLGYMDYAVVKDVFEIKRPKL